MRGGERVRGGEGVGGGTVGEGSETQGIGVKREWGGGGIWIERVFILVIILSY